MKARYVVRWEVAGRSLFADRLGSFSTANWEIDKFALKGQMYGQAIVLAEAIKARFKRDRVGGVITVVAVAR